MSEELIITGTSKEEVYLELLAQLKSLLEGEENHIACLALIAAALKEAFGFFWIGFYLIDELKGNLVLGPFQGPIACLRIQFNKGVCGTAWAQLKTIIVPDVDQFPGHISCNSKSRSEIVVPLFSDLKILGVLDIDSENLNDFNEIDQHYLEKILAINGIHSQGK